MKIFYSITLLAVSLGASANPCLYMAPIVKASFESTKFKYFQDYYTFCSPNDMSSTNCKVLETKYGVDMESFFNDKEYHSYLGSLAIKKINDSGAIAIDYTVKMLTEISGDLKGTAIDEVNRLNKVRPVVTVKELTKSLKRMKGTGLCR
ncbi:hypothetical protein OL305_004593 [Vibrio parahaemolyticus]|uniref:hypothetical protein n=1 Tax=Vibrio parahaemolyticus TaxID=670 RepID=UPI002492A308|nr:hypothetical protein [Vibrio parahaemolyticus]EKA7412773.1 hypothetical protein [Vibrio parahaemolyticus]